MPESTNSMPTPSCLPGRQDRLIMLGLVTLVLSCYCWVLNQEFSTYDDPQNVTNVTEITSGLSWSGVVWCFTEFSEANWNPLSRLSHMAAWQVFGDFAGGHAMVNVALHCVNTLLLFWVVRRLTGRVWRAGIVALLFGLHPIHVESVAWISERKDVLFTFFGLLMLWAYAAFAARQSMARYALVLVLFVCSLLSKPMLVTAPMLLLLLDFWPLKRVDMAWTTREERRELWVRWWPLLLEKLPFLAISVAISAVTMAAQRAGFAVRSMESIPLGFRLANVFVAYVQYLGKMVWPLQLGVLYPLPDEGYPAWETLGAWAFLMVASGGILVQARRRPMVFVGWFWFLVSLVPVIGLVQVGSQAYADRYMYWSGMGLYVAVVWVVCDAWMGSGGADSAHGLASGAGPSLASAENQSSLTAAKHASAGSDHSWRMIPGGVLIALVAAVLWALTFQQVHFWQSPGRLYQHTMDVTDKNHMIGVNLASWQLTGGDWTAARRTYEQVLRDSPTDINAYLGLATMDRTRGDMAAVMRHYKDAIEAVPFVAGPYTRMGTVLMDMGKLEEAKPYFEKAVELDPDAGIAQGNLGVILIREGHPDQAIEPLERAASLMPDKPQILMNLGGALGEMGRMGEAEEQFRAVVQHWPDLAEARLNLGVVLLNTGRYDEASQEFREVLRLRPNLSKAAQLLQLSEQKRLGAAAPAGGSAGPKP